MSHDQTIRDRVGVALALLGVVLLAFVAKPVATSWDQLIGITVAAH